MIRIGICDDNSAFLHQAKFIIDHWDDRPTVITTEIFEDGDALIRAHSEIPFDIILMDVVMPLLDGIETSRELRKNDKTVRIVFLTSSPDFAVDSYSVKASDYLLKPFNPTRLFSCLAELISDIQSTAHCVSVKSIDATYRLLLSDIEFIESQGKHIVFSLSDGRAIESTEPLYVYENILTLEDGFFKCHRSYIINMHYISSYSSKECIMRSGCRVPIARSCHKDFDAVYFSVIFEKAGADG